jgi:hypothetical protein
VGALPGTSSALAGSLTPPSTVSRYRSDFNEANRLGQGGFGVVVAAVNRCGGGRRGACRLGGSVCRAAMCPSFDFVGWHTGLS